jgi:hypothetical protein
MIRSRPDYNPLLLLGAPARRRVVVIGGECNWEANPDTGVFLVRGQAVESRRVYNPYNDTWTPLPGPTGWGSIGDMMCTVMPLDRPLDAGAQRQHAARN